ncbi:MAG TPA: hypothetical protein VIW46_06465 [Acidimicrobiia bacterium]|jgi:hypothetical protein
MTATRGDLLGGIEFLRLFDGPHEERLTGHLAGQLADGGPTWEFTVFPSVNCT